MNIGIDIRSLMTSNRTGVGEYTYELLNAVFSLDNKNKYFLFYNSSKDVGINIPKWKQTNVVYVWTRWPNKLFNTSIKLLRRPKLDKLLNDKQIDIFFSPNLNFTTLSLNTKFVLTIHDLSFVHYPEFYSTKQRLWHCAISPKKQCERADLIITPSENTKRDIVDIYGINANKIRVIYPGLSTVFSNIGYCHSASDHSKGGILDINNTDKLKRRNEVKKKYDLPQNYILFLGTIEPRKNIIGLIEAYEVSAEILSKKYPLSNIQYLLIAGPNGWKYENIYERARASKYAKYIKFIGYVDQNDKPALYSAASLFVYPSFYEGFGFPVLEAMACETPVITSNRSSLPEVVGDCAYLTNPNKPWTIAEGIVRILTDTKLADYYRQKGLERTKEFAWKKTAEQVVSTFNSLNQ